METTGFRSNVRVILLRKFDSEAKARIYQARFREVGIPCFLSNTHMSQILPMHDSGFSLHIQEDDLEDARDLMLELDRKGRTRSEGPFHDADIEDIRFEEAISKMELRLHKAKDAFAASALVIGSMVVALAVLIYLFVSKVIP